MENNNTKQLFGNFEKAMKEWQAAIKKNDTEVADIMQKRVNDIYKEYKDEIEYQNKAMEANIGELGAMFESALPTLLIKNKKCVREIMRLIKEDKNIKTQLQFFETMKNYDGTTDAKDYIKESIELASNNIDVHTLKESNKKLSDLILKHNIKSDEPITEDKSAFFKAGIYLLTHKKNLGNLSQMTANRNIVESYILNHKKTIEEDKSQIIKTMTESFDKNMAILTEEERMVVMDIINSKSPIAEKKQKKFFDDLKGKCIDKIDTILLDSNEDEKSALASIKDEISSMEYNKETVIKDTAKLLEIGAVLSDSDNQKFM